MNALIERPAIQATRTDLHHIKHYRLLHLLKAGGMARVYLAYDTYTRQHVAVKLTERGRCNEELFAGEVRAMRLLNHPHILPLLDAGRNERWNYIVMPYISGGTLQDYIEQRILTMDEVARVLEQVIDAVQYMHACGITHRDIKPSNILMNGDDIYLADFGIALQQEEEVMYFPKLQMGTPPYMAPETYEGEISHQCDLYALGVVFYQMVTGCVPFENKNILSIYWKQKMERPLSPSLFNPYISPNLEQVILRALEGEQAARFQTIGDFAEACRKAFTPSLLKRLTSSFMRTVHNANPYRYPLACGV